MRSLLVFITILVLNVPASGQGVLAPADDNSHWDAEFRSVGFGFGGISDFVFLDNLIVACGYFQAVDGHRTSGVAYYDGAVWHPMGIGQDDLVEVTSLVPDGRYLYAGGRFFMDPRAPLHNLARWDSQTHSWSDVDGGVRSPTDRFQRIDAMVRIGDDLYIGGQFDTAGSVVAHNIVRYNLRDGSWHPLGAGVGGDARTEVVCLSTDSTFLYVGGLFTMVGGKPANSVARWNIKSETWDNFGLLPDSNQTIEIDAIYRYGDSLIVGGRFDSIGGVVAHDVAKFDGVWKSFGNLLLQARHFSTFNNQLIETGWECGIDDCGNDFEVWDGARWNYVDTRVSKPDAIHIHNGELYASGVFYADSGRELQIAKFHLPDSAWIPLDIAAPSSQINHIARVKGKTYCTGSTWEADGGYRRGPYYGNVFEVREGQTWKLLERDGQHSNAPIFSDGTSLYCFGMIDRSQQYYTPTLERYDEASNTWELLDTMSGAASSPNGVLIHDSVIYIGSKFDTVNGIAARNVISYDLRQRKWIPLGAGIPCGYWYGSVTALAWFHGDLIAGGRFDTTIPNILRFDHALKEWVPLGDTVMRGNVQSLTASSSHLYVGGKFDTVGGKTIRFVAQWDGQVWQPVGPAIDSNWYEVSIETMGMQDDSDLIIGGFFWSIGGVPISHIARWDGHSWHPFGNGTNERVTEMAIDGRDIYVGGYFTAAGDLGANGFAHWRSTAESISPAGVSGLNASVYPNPASESVSVEIQLATASRLQVDLYATDGVYIASLFDADVAAGNGFYWSDLSSLGLANGPYFLAVRAEGKETAILLHVVR